MNSLINYVYEFGSGRGKFRKHMYVSIFNEFLKLINYVYEFGSGRGKFRKHINVSIFNEFLN